MKYWLSRFHLDPEGYLTKVFTKEIANCQVRYRMNHICSEKLTPQSRIYKNDMEYMADRN